MWSLYPPHWSLNKASLQYVSQTSQNNLSKIFFGKESFRQYQGRKTNKSLNCLAFLDSKKTTILAYKHFINSVKWNEVRLWHVQICQGLKFSKIARNKTAFSTTMSLIAGRYSQNLVGWSSRTSMRNSQRVESGQLDWCVYSKSWQTVDAFDV